jgi:hypothetical protein
MTTTIDRRDLRTGDIILAISGTPLQSALKAPARVSTPRDSSGRVVLDHPVPGQEWLLMLGDQTRLTIHRA